MADLKRYRDKRDPERTPEPYGDEASPRALAPGARAVFVVQQHAARRMHWDLRLEIDGVLASWAVPRGPSLDPAEKRLAVRTEDHPLEYARFEGIIPEGNYGAGAMIVWDVGAWQPVGETAPRDGLEAGKLDLRLEGHKLRGRFALVRTRGEGGRDWLLICKGKAPADAPELVEREPASVLSGLRVEELRDGVARDAEVAEAATRAGAPRRRLDAARLRPMLAETREEPFSDPAWLYELKYDGVRVLAERSGDAVRLLARTGAERTATYPEVARALAHLPLGEFVIDGELLVPDGAGGGSFERIQQRFTQTDRARIARGEVDNPVVLQAFDCLGAAGHDLRRLPLAERKRILARFAPRLGVVRFADHVEGDGEALFRAAEQHGLEGVIAKRADSPYEAGRRSAKWIKVKAPRHGHLAVVGVLPGKGSRESLGSLALAWQRDGELVHAGNAGSGLDDAAIEAILARVPELRVAEPAFAGAPERPPRGTLWLRPVLVCEVRYTEVTGAGSLRQPVFLGLAEDVGVDACHAPAALQGASASASAPEPAAAGDGTAAEPPRLELTRLDKVFWPVERYTKGDLLAWYEAAWPFLAPYLEDRPVVLTRYPDGIEGKHFYQKNAPEFTPAWVRRASIDGTDYFLCNDLETLLYVVNSGAIPLHVWSARVGDLEHPDWLILDLDPKEAPFSQVVAVARHLHALLEDLGAAHFAKTSGQDGLHVLLPLAGRLDHGAAKALGEAVARTVCSEIPELATIARPLAARGRKVYVDYLQNGRGKLIAAPLSVRPRPGAPVSMPLTWAQVTARLDPGRWTVKTALPRLRRHGDPFRGVLGEGVDVAELLEGLTRRLSAAGA